ncbi:uncharacterized protein ACBT44_002350 isoform 2-T2 [Syngnathus typhle]
MDSPPANNLSIEGSQALPAISINSQTLPSDSNSPEYYPWPYQNPCFLGFQGAAFCYQNDGAQVVPIGITTTQPAYVVLMRDHERSPGWVIKVWIGRSISCWRSHGCNVPEVTRQPPSYSTPAPFSHRLCHRAAFLVNSPNAA